MSFRCTMTLPDSAATMSLATALAPRLRRGDVIALTGDLGMGKTTFARALIQALCGPDMVVPSPTFTLLQSYDTPMGVLWHCDWYRLKTAAELDELGWDDRADALALVEWADRAPSALPRATLWLHFTTDGAGRRLQGRGAGDWATRLKDFL